MRHIRLWAGFFLVNVTLRRMSGGGAFGKRPFWCSVVALKRLGAYIIEQLTAGHSWIGTDFLGVRS